MENGSNRSQRRHQCVYCAVSLSLHWCCMGFWQYTVQFLHTETERLTLTDEDTNVKLLTTAVNPLFTADAKEFLIKSSVNTLFHKIITYGSTAKFNVLTYKFCIQNPTPFSLFFLLSRRQAPPNLTSHDCRALCFEAQQHGMLDNKRSYEYFTEWKFDLMIH